MRKLILQILVFLPITLFSQSAQLSYSKVQICSKDTLLIDNDATIVFSKNTLIIQNKDKRINSFIVPGSEFDKLDVIIFDDTNTMIANDSTSKTVVYSSINHSTELGVKISKSIMDSLVILKRNNVRIVFKK